MKNKIIIAIIIVAILIIGFVFVINRSLAPTEQTSPTEESNATSTVATTSVTNSPTSSAIKDPKVEAWELFEKYLAYNKNQNLDGVKSLVYKISKVCDTPKPSTECKARMSSAYTHGSALKKEDFVNVWSDDRQTVLATNFWTESSEDLNLIGRFRSIIIFVRDDKDTLKLLNFSPTKGGATALNSAPEQELNDRIVRWSDDRDNDAIADYDEECLGKQGEVACVKTNPKVRDTDGDGWWDGINAAMRSL